MENEALMLGLQAIGKGLLALGALGGAIGVGNVFSSYLTGVARNPSAQDKMFTGAMIGAAFAEALGLISFVMMFII